MDGVRSRFEAAQRLTNVLTNNRGEMSADSAGGLWQLPPCSPPAGLARLNEWSFSRSGLPASLQHERARV